MGCCGRQTAIQTRPQAQKDIVPIRPKTIARMRITNSAVIKPSNDREKNRV